MDRLDAMTVLLATVETGSLSAASRRLGMPLATVSRKVADLEAHLNTRLLIRSSRHVALTDAGRAYVEASRVILEKVDEAERAAAGEYIAPRGELTVTAPVVFGRLHVLPIVVEFLKSYPEINLRLSLSDRQVNLVEDHIDLAIRIGTLPDSNMIATKVGSIRRAAYASPAYLARRGTPQRPEDLALHDCITFEGFTSPTVWTFMRGRKEVAVPVHSRLSVTTAEAAVDAAVADLGVTRILSYQAAQAMAAGDLQIVLEAFEPPPWPISAIYIAQGPAPLKLRAFLDFAVPRLRERML
ncbi:LysR family transcriptional regulator [Phyllobacterium brassicacearum]|uniref:LysR family transcriptional regulator n=1 Tax=Phyllobacterium brassicacearum TaxID=314235 RepID=A0A2P7AJQ2_9HYPH|nr:LysR family transcriptional regulator [Phyllobacterium brassicacearum]PSH54437.1 LysR family transcriptional regulator [Phyllobacterium brassicacearum]TDQ30533.1 LysR family transcriptional regulator [Phyllobacterium brassicacearum]